MGIKSYNIDKDNAKWLTDMGATQERSASWYLNKLLTDIRTKSKTKKKTEVAVPEEDVILWLPCKSGQHPVTKDDVMQYMATYRNINMEQELKSMFSWLEANKAKQKTKAGMKRFINSWLSRANEKGGSGVWMGDY